MIPEKHSTEKEITSIGRPRPDFAALMAATNCVESTPRQLRYHQLPQHLGRNPAGQVVVDFDWGLGCRVAAARARLPGSILAHHDQYEVPVHGFTPRNRFLLRRTPDF